MSTSPTSKPITRDERQVSYTSPRPDVSALVPSGARRILDVGCSNGALGKSLKAAQPGIVVGGIEYDADFVHEAATGLDFVVHGDLNALDWNRHLGDRHFDCIIFADVLEHLVQPRQCLMQARKRLSAGGCVVLSVPNIRHVSALGSIFLLGRFPQRSRGIFDATHLRWFTISDALRLLRDCGLEPCAVTSTLRWGDRGGGRLNRWLNRLPHTVQQWAPIREFLTYQVCVRAEIR